MWILCCPEFDGFQKFGGVMFLVGPPKDKFALSSFSPYFLLFGYASL